ncbi:MAG: MBL fold metallo-hydrolase [Candidatus Thermoplasmatota archaeon]|jgi:putative mRNA 3-end processing factor|nr:MBL fold metallo-hydrolase [Candidatus Thermoplasmatota archaeon]MCL5785217.1 MBL fold metallo-hydrolase [Candidatus Thermoplasmatota archaeon]
MKIKFLGGAEEVGRLAIKIENKDTRVMVDYGVIPEKPPLYPMPPEPVDGLFLTHSHLDHAGSLPIYYHSKQARFYATMMTANSIRPLLNDSLKIAALEGYPEVFNSTDVDQLYESLVPVRYGEEVEEGNFSVVPYSAGHIPGSTMWQFNNSRSTLVTGDLNTEQSNLLDGAVPVKSDVLVIESTYAGKNHEPREQVIKRLRKRVREVVESGGKVIFPTFAVGRTQELAMILADLDLNIATDGMGNGITDIYMHTPGYLRSYKDFKRAIHQTRRIRGNGMRSHALENDVIITTSGMMDGGPVLGYVDKLLTDEKSAIFLTGYQVENTNGRSLMENGTLKIAGNTVKPLMQKEFFDLSAHAGHDSLVKFVRGVSPETVILCHGEQRENLLSDLAEFEVILPMNGQEFEVK